LFLGLFLAFETPSTAPAGDSGDFLSFCVSGDSLPPFSLFRTYIPSQLNVELLEFSQCAFRPHSSKRSSPGARGNFSPACPPLRYFVPLATDFADLKVLSSVVLGGMDVVQ